MTPTDHDSDDNDHSLPQFSHTGKEADSDLNALVIKAITSDWQNITGVMSAVFDDPAFNKNRYNAQDVAECIYVLVDSGQIDVQGNMRRWREGQIKRK